MPKRLVTCLWFDGNAREAAEYYARTFPDSRIVSIICAPADYPDGMEGDVLTVDLTIMGAHFVALNANAQFRFSEAISFQILTGGQAETDRYWHAIVGDGGAAGECGWLKDRFGLSWQVIPRALVDAIGGSDRAAAKRAMKAMTDMGKIDVAAIEAAIAG